MGSSDPGNEPILPGTDASGSKKQCKWGCNCGNGRIHLGCMREMCRKHCREKGGCPVKTHALPGAFYPTASSVALQTVPLPASQPLASVSASASRSGLAASGLDITASASRSDGLPPTDSNAVSVPIGVPQSTQDELREQRDPRSMPATDPRPDARYISQLPAIFTEQYRREQEMHEKRRQDETQRLEAEKRVRQKVTVYIWLDVRILYSITLHILLTIFQDEREPEAVVIQDGFHWPTFTLDEPTLCSLKIPIDPQNIGCAQLYENNVRCWYTIRLGHTVDVRQYNQHLFLRATCVGICRSLDRLFDMAMMESKPHLRDSLRLERTSVRRASEVIQTTPSSSKRRLDSSPPLRDEHQVKKRVVSSPLGLGLSLPSPSSSSVSSLAPLSSFGSICVSQSISSTQSSVPASPAAVIKQECVELALVAPTCGTSIDNAIDIDAGSNDPLSPASYEYFKRWPQDFYACDIRDAFGELDALVHTNQAIGPFFTARFKVSFVSSTYYSHRLRWYSASQEIRDKMILAGRTDAGLWTVFMKLTPAHDAEYRAEKKRAIRRAKFDMSPS
ncbi:hypothetical protein GLOTRDRAFT_97361 [Gloeophyllum trabeum ATCC 11539]|uniref:Uncharacterized protein n=1 Tax=Gloeophyllum trabeum (strain ATCC 11539 / FP-39264 / Madison 617) TaxID=670483 RepID=S7PQQ9_GLOTA|nr:uncharacterized protein GLOTRDRAFT_97361 [Gloeophyllum trabeum ATCC 11539]EPQ49803.1 hypothetical protein GLOTRDRAFT_97361 [Gloeophyllum trabeum ATCC 11539]